MKIEKVQSRVVPLELLLSADPSRKIINKYIESSDIWIAKVDDIIVGSIVVKPLTDTTAEIKNIAVLEVAQHQGIGSKLIEFTSNYYSKIGIKELVIGTGNSSFQQLKLYQKLGFHVYDVISDFFVEHYEEPIFENGIRCESMIMLKKKLNN